MTKYLTLIALALLASACSRTESLTGPSGAPVSSQRSLADEPKIGSLANSCNSDAPRSFRASVHGETNYSASVDFEAIGVNNVAGYEVEVQQNSTNIWVPILLLQSPRSVLTAPQRLLGAVYRARMRTMQASTCDDGAQRGRGAWTAFVVFSIASPPAPPTPEPLSCWHEQGEGWHPCTDGVS